MFLTSNRLAGPIAHWILKTNRNVHESLFLLRLSLPANCFYGVFSKVKSVVMVDTHNLMIRRSHVLVSLKLQILFSTVDAPASHGFLKVKALLSLLMPMETYVYERNKDCIGDSSFPVINDQSQFSVAHARSNKVIWP
ncbi:uncharacterized protein LOC131233329 isoform X2 [Magnolia sinica]|uniref:uncharacterized protein LOC131233329 isoform X2 n=1 Tax=Magnolia sinica TaxID=86752 RepID=UPI00265845B9|nr:uncharacterized protein LOC131233329 isoform X2 [Magnolia sinica]